MKLKLIIRDKVYDEVTIIVRGDFDGDGRVSSVDVIGLVNIIYKTTKLDYLYLQALDVVKLDERVSSVDIIHIVNYINKSIDTLNPSSS